jgi:hypothetical protein
MTYDPHLASLLLTTAVGGLMLLAGVGKRALERRPRRCPSCGRAITSRCPTCS